MDNKAIREESLEYLRKLNLPYNQNLPLLAGVHKLRDLEARCKRVFCMHAAAAVAYGFPKANVIQWIESESLGDSLADSEARFIYERRGDMSWFQAQIEAMWVIVWSLGVVEELDFKSGCDQNFVSLLPNLKEAETTKRFRDAVNSRSVVEVLKAADLAYCLHWSAVHASLQGKELNSPVQPYVITQRRKGLDWVIGDEPWDEVSLDT